MGAVKINGTTSGSVSLEAPASGSDVTLTLPGTTMNLGTELASKLPIAGGKILQVVRATDSTNRSTSSTSHVDANLSVTITPQKSDSAILLIWFGQVLAPSSDYIILQIADSSNNSVSGGDAIWGDGTAATFIISSSIIGYATPATTSATTYKLRFRVGGGTGTIRNVTQNGQLYAIEVSA